MHLCLLLKIWAQILVKTCDKYSQKLLDNAYILAADALKAASKRVIQKNNSSNW